MGSHCFVSYLSAVYLFLVASPDVFRGGPARRGRRNQKERLAGVMDQSWLNHGPQQPNGRYPRFLVDRVVVPHGSALIWLPWIRIRADPDPGARKFIKINK
jgi:hypothetical protein